MCRSGKNTASAHFFTQLGSLYPSKFVKVKELLYFRSIIYKLHLFYINGYKNIE